MHHPGLETFAKRMARMRANKAAAARRPFHPEGETLFFILFLPA
jgi:hypothetical protein